MILKTRGGPGKKESFKDAKSARQVPATLDFSAMHGNRAMTQRVAAV